jgi:Ser/Thr protein kinase RdoA (MazF antagonist)
MRHDRGFGYNDRFSSNYGLFSPKDNRMFSESLPVTIAIQHSIVSTGAISAVLDQGYDLGPILECRLVRSWCNEVYQIQSSSGAYFAKLHRLGWRDTSAVTYETELIQYLSRQIPVAPVLPRAGFRE